MRTPENSSSRPSWLKVASTIVIIIAIWVPRVIALDRPVTVDESRWAARSANFFLALDQQEFASTFQKEHPGVTTMSAGALGLLWHLPDFEPGDAGQINSGNYPTILEEYGHTILQLITAGRFFMVLANTIALALAYIFAQRLLGLVPAFIGFLLIAFDPFHVAHSRLLHLDGLLSSLLLLALLTFLYFGQERRVSALIVSGVAAGLSWLTRSPGLFLIPTVGLLSALDALNNRSLRSLAHLPALVWQFAWPLILWGLVAIVVFVALWPAMWVDPIGSLSGVFAAPLSDAAKGHHAPLFFNGQIYADGRVDTPTFYPINYLWRSTPVVLVGILIAAIGFVFRREPLNDPKTRRAVLGLVVFVVVFAVLQNLGAKKFDRYLLPVFLPLDLIAAVGWVTMANWLTSGRVTPMRRHAASWLLVVLVAVQAIGTFSTFPYYLSYYNPLLGGSRNAPEVMMIGWGEGLDQAAYYLNEKPNAHNLRVLTWYPLSFRPYFVGTTDSIIEQPDITKAQLKEILEWHYAVVYIHQWQRQMPTRLLDHLAPQTPVHSIWIDGLEYARIYKLISVPEPPLPSQSVTEGNLGELARLVGYDPSPPFQATAGTTLPLTLTWEATGIFDQDYTVFIHVVGGDKRPLTQVDRQPVSGGYPTTFWDVGERLGDPYQLVIPSNLPPGEYELLVGMYLTSTGERLPLLGADGQVLGDSISLGQVTVTQP